MATYNLERFPFLILYIFSLICIRNFAYVVHIHGVDPDCHIFHENVVVQTSAQITNLKAQIMKFLFSKKVIQNGFMSSRSWIECI